MLNNPAYFAIAPKDHPHRRAAGEVIYEHEFQVVRKYRPVIGRNFCG